jgi:hypothetical protein
MTDCFGITKLCKTIQSGREWASKWHLGNQRSYSFGPAGTTDPDLIFRGNGKYTIFGSTGTNSGQMSVTGSCPRIYVRNSNVSSSKLSTTVAKWGNVEITFYANTIDAGQSTSYAGIEAVAMTNHFPDEDLCSTRGYGAKINFDGRAEFEKECVHNGGNKRVATVYPFLNNGKMPIKQWIGMKYLCRSCENRTKCKLELFMDMTDGLNGGTWNKVTEFTDYDGWSSDQVSCCDIHKGKVLLPPNMNENYSVYLRSDNLGQQLYKKFTIREIEPLL